MRDHDMIQMNFIKRTFTIVIFSYFLISCSNEEKTSIPLSYPKEEGVKWTHTIYKYDSIDTLKIGSVTTTNLGLESFQKRAKVLNQKKEIRLDSLANTLRPVTVRYTFTQENDGVIDLFADSYFDIFDGLLTNVVLDTLSTGKGDEEYQRFNFISPGWVKWFNFAQDPEIPIPVHPSYRVFLDFRNRAIHITGTVSTYSESRFDEFDVVKTEDGQLILTYKYLIRTYYDFDLKRDGETIPTFRIASDFYQWIHESAGIIQRERKPFELFVPQVPSRYPLMYIPGEIWKLKSVTGLSL